VKDLTAESVKGFKKYLESQNTNTKTVNEIFRNAIKYHHILYEGNGSELTTYSIGKRKHVMKALAAFSKYSGCYETWQNIRKQYQLKWTSTDSLAGFHNILKKDEDLTRMVEWIKMAIEKYPRISNILQFDVLTGLRPTEVIESFNMLLDPVRRTEYLSNDGQTLEHFRFPGIFLRRTKKTSISIVNEEIMNLAQKNQNDFLNYDRLD